MGDTERRGSRLYCASALQYVTIERQNVGTMHVIGWIGTMILTWTQSHSGYSSETMARTKQTAMRSTGGPAKTVSLTTLWNAATTTSVSPQTTTCTMRICNRSTVSKEVVISVSANRQWSPTGADNTSQQWCCLCYDGGKLVVCKTCEQAACDCCILFLHGSLMETVIFTCPDCWLKGVHKMDPYTICVSFLHH